VQPAQLLPPAGQRHVDLPGRKLLLYLRARKLNAARLDGRLYLALGRVDLCTRCRSLGSRQRP
jgi:hypothetical protein